MLTQAMKKRSCPTAIDDNAKKVKKTIETTHNLAAADREICVIEFLSPRYDLKQYSRLLAFIWAWGH